MQTPLRLDRSVLALEGEDAERLLNDLITNDLAKLEPQGLLYAALLSAPGKVLADFFIQRDGPQRFLVDVAPERAGPLLQRFKLYRLRARAEMEDVSTRYEVVAGGALGLPDPRLPALGSRVIRPAEPATPRDDGAYAALARAAGVPNLSRDLAPEEAFALEALLEELHGVDFHKGCFVGQETVSRMKRRATTRRKLCPVTFQGPAPAFGARITAGAADLGDIRTGAEGEAFAFLRLDRAQEAIAAGQTLLVEGRPIALSPPAWLILPPVTAGEG